MNLIPTDSGITQLCKEPVVVVDGLVAFFDSYSRMVNPETFTDMKWRSMTAINQLKIKLKMPQEQAEKVWDDYCRQRNWPFPSSQQGNITTSPAPAPAPAETPSAGGIYGITCGICTQPLNGEPYVFSGIKRGNIHIKCEGLLAKVGQ